MADISQINLPNDNNNPYAIKDESVPHSSLAAASGGTDLSLVTTGEKYTWNNKSNVGELNDLSDVDTTGVFNGAVLTYISNDDKWEAFSVPQQLPPPVESLQNVIETTPEYAGQVLKLSHGTPVTKWTNDYVSYNELTDTPTFATVATSGSYNDLSDKPTVATTCSISKGASMPSGFPVPQIARRGNVVIIRFGINFPAGTYTNTDALWNYTPAMTGLPVITVPLYGSGQTNLFNINTNGTITINSTKTFASDTWIIGEAVFLTDG